ncbi:NTPase KAP family P-loop domain-containing protein 1-like [Alligator mississippiensis]|uniref:NTPase KAP family P-loop domain-containing protein 1-like n=1 Tax=Alligator mississippiensis TaxID=8496 RepID=UPI0007117210|nr:NTPase KAP family P-loop domain-containing protein 1-like [Alligator mississippiensis]XP_059574203.1 NTPase KAP family P-loop domain-containing protein 1-like [Alligator mississippiensis]
MVSPARETQSIEDVYSQSLAKALYHIPTPAIVGFYAPWGYGISQKITILRNILQEKSRKKDERDFQQTGQRQRGNSSWDLLNVLLHMIFYRPVLTEQHKERRNIQHVFIHFSAWEYVGSDNLWAGLITALCDGIQRHFGLLPISVYRVMGQKCSLSDGCGDKKWICKRYLCLPVWAVGSVLAIVVVAVGFLFFVLGTPVGDTWEDMMKAILESIGIAVLGISTLAVVKPIFLVIRNIINTQKAKLEKLMNRTDLSAQLGFMSCVKREVKVITEFLKFMEIFQRRKIRVVLEITNLDRCSPSKVVGILDALNILLADDTAPFISILAVDPSIIIDCVGSSGGTAKNGYKFLNHMVTLPFSVPKMDDDTKKHLIRSIIGSQQEQEGDLQGVGIRPTDKKEASLPLTPHDSLASRSIGSLSPDESQVPLVIVSDGPWEPSNSCARKATKTLIQEALHSLLEDSMKEYMTDNFVQIQRIVNTISITVRLMVMKVSRDKVFPQMVAAWVLLANQWPCRLSWILQCIEDEEQRNSLDGCQGNLLPPDMPLWEVYEKYMEEFDLIKGPMEKMLELDSDPDLFYNFIHDWFRVEDANFYLPFTVNLDSSLKRQMELQRGSRSLKWTKKARSLSKGILLAMSVDDICKEMATLGFKEDNLQIYVERVRKHDLSGRALIYSNNSEIKEVLGMSLGEWTHFSIRFFGVLPQPGSSNTAESSVLSHVRPKVLENEDMSGRLPLDTVNESQPLLQEHLAGHEGK